MTAEVEIAGYRLQPGWAHLPPGWHFVDVSGLAIDAQDRVYVFSRSDHPVTVFDRGGALVASFGEGMFARPHSIAVAEDGTIWCTDDGNQTVSRFTAAGERLLQFGGSEGAPGCPPIGRITGIAIAPGGDVLVGDTHAATILRFSPAGDFLGTFGGPGTGVGEFADPHFFWFDRGGRLWVVDRDNNRIQIFDAALKPVEQWTGLARPTALFIAGDDTVYVSEGRQQVSIFSRTGERLAHFGSQGEDTATALFHTPHAIVVDSSGDIYVGENRHGLGATDPAARAVQKFTRVPPAESENKNRRRSLNVVSA